MSRERIPRKQSRSALKDEEWTITGADTLAAAVSPLSSSVPSDKKEKKDGNPSLPFLLRVTDYVGTVRMAQQKLSMLGDDSAKLQLVEQVKSVIGNQIVRMRLHAFLLTQGVTATTAAPQFEVNMNPFFTNGPIQGRTDQTIFESSLSTFFQSCFTHSMEVTVHVKAGNIPAAAATAASHLMLMYEGDPSQTQSTTLATAVSEGMTSGRKVWLTHSQLTADTVSSVMRDPVLKLSVPNPYGYSSGSFGWVSTTAGTSNRTQVNYTGSTAYAGDTDALGSILVEFDCSLRIRNGG